MPDRQYVFAEFRLDPDSQELWRGQQLIPLRPKLFAVLRRLLENAGRLVTREELRAEAWPKTAVSESVLRGTIRELRDVLGDDAASARFIETLPHRGYRFIAEVCSETPSNRAAVDRAPAAPTATPAGKPQPLIGRDAELAHLQHWLQRATQGSRQIVFVTGEPGIGKTTLVDAFAAAVENSDRLWTARGQCVEHYGTAEAYLPVLDALGQLCRQPERDHVVAVLSRHAPTWLAQMPGVVGDVELQLVQRRAEGATRERMLRELAEALEALTAQATLILMLEDLHWSDYSTLDLISLLAQRRTPARLLLLATYRPADVAARGHPLEGLRQELHIHQQCEELPLRFLNPGEVDQYLDARFPQQQLPGDLATALHRSTEGSPLFMVNVVDYWLAQHLLVEDAGQWRLAARVEDLAAGVPDSLRQLIEKQLARLSPDEARILEVASIGGIEFSAAVVAAALEEDAERVEAHCEALARRNAFLRSVGIELVGAGGVSGRYGFRHALYQQALYERVAPARRARLHRRIGECAEAAYAARLGDIAGELAMHFERGHDAERAIRHLTRAGESALRRSAHPEAIALLGRGLELLQSLPDSAERAAHELVLQTMVGAALAVTRGYAAPEVEAAHTRAFQLCRQMAGAPQLFPALAGLWGFHFLRAEVHTAADLAAQLSDIAGSVGDSALVLWAETLQGLTSSMRGDSSAALRHLERGLALYDPTLHGPDRTQVGAQDPKVTCLAYQAWTLWRMGYPDQARRRIADTLAWARQLSHPFSVAFGLGFGATGVGMFLRDASAVATQSEMLMAMSREQGFPYWLGWGGIWHGAAQAWQGEPQVGMATMREGLATLERTGAQLGRSYILAQFAEVHASLGQAAEGLALLEQALALVESTGERWYEAELHRLKGTLLLEPVRRAARRSPNDAAAACFHRAIQVAQRQGVKSFELRAATNLSRLWQQQGKRTEARALLRDVYGWFSEGFETADLRDARALLDELA